MMLRSRVLRGSANTCPKAQQLGTESCNETGLAWDNCMYVFNLPICKLTSSGMSCSRVEELQ
jgi:hypothetical protein